MPSHSAWSSCVLVLSIVGLVGGCLGDDPSSTGDPSNTSGTDGGGGGNGEGGVPGADGGDGVCSPGAKSCAGGTLRTCKADASGFDEIECAQGCVPTPAVHCKGIVPSKTGVTAADLDGTGLAKTVIVVTAILDSGTGAISNGVRAPNTDPNKREVISGIAFHQVPMPAPAPSGQKLGIFSFEDFTIGDGKNVVATGPNALAIVAANEIKILGLLDARGTCVDGAGGPGGGRGGSVAGGAGGAGPGAAGASNQSGATSGGGGGGYGDDGGNTLQVGVGGTTAGGIPYGNLTLVPLLGGSGGGRGGDANSTTASVGGIGGGGGGAIQLVAGTRIVVGGGSAVGGINAGGCGGAGAKVPVAINNAGCGGGGGSGGAVLIEAPDVKLDLLGSIVANGGAGGGGATGMGATATAGEPGKLTWDQTQFFGGTSSGSGCGNGGFGGASARTPSTNKGQNGAVGGSGNCTGGGGGGAGRVRVNSTSGAMVVVRGDSYVSPDFPDQNSHLDPISSQGKIVVE